MRDTLGRLASDDPANGGDRGVTTERDDRPADVVLATDGLAVLTTRTTAAYSAAAERSASAMDARPVDVFGRLSTEPDPRRRRDSSSRSSRSGKRSTATAARPARTASAAGATAEAWSATSRPSTRTPARSGSTRARSSPGSGRSSQPGATSSVSGPVEPWDQRHETGAFRRTFDADLPLTELRRIDRAYYASLGADPEALGIRYDIAPRPGPGSGRDGVHARRRDLPRRGPDGWSTGEQWVVASYSRPRIPTLASSSTRPAMPSTRGRPDPTRLRRHDRGLHHAHRGARRHRRLGSLRAGLAGTLARRSAPVGAGLRARYGDVVRDVAWSLFEIVLHRRPSASRTRSGPRSPATTWVSCPTPSGRGGRSAGSSSRRPATWSTTASGRS